jgi:hypothetical protein
MTDNCKAPLIVTTNVIRDGRVLLQVLPKPATGTVGADIAARQDPGRRACSLVENDKLLLKARLIVTNSKDGATTLHSLNVDRQQVGTMSSTALVLVLGRLGGYFESGKLFFLKGSLELSDGTVVSFLDTAPPKRHAASARMLTVEALVT